MHSSKERITAFLGSLSADDLVIAQDALRQRLGAMPAVPSAQPAQSGMGRFLPSFVVDGAVYDMDAEQLRIVEHSFMQRVDAARNGQQRLSRLRILLVFMLLRHAGLRFGEVTSFNDAEDVDVKRGIVRVRGPYAREVPLSATVIEQIHKIVSAPEAQTLSGHLTELDGGYVRRCLYARARECDVPAGALSARALRNMRAIELCRSGMPMKIVHAFLGQSSTDRTTALMHYSTKDAHTIMNHYLRKEMQMKTSARNVFPGKVSKLVTNDFLVEVTLDTFGGLKIVSVITDTSCATLGLEEGKTVIATVKAPWVMLEAPAALNAPSSARNRFLGKVASVRRSPIACEVVVDMPEGSQVCALLTSDSVDNLTLEVGAEVCVQFKAFAVILGLE